jgi:probable F420-dependent oxidoreductase
MKLGLYGLHKGENTAPEALARRAKAAEDAGFESLWVGDHIALPPDAPDDAYDARLEALVTLAHLAAVTGRVKLGAGVIILPQRQPVLLAKQLTSIDVLSAGRLIVGLGVGYLEAELSALGASLPERGARMDEGIAAMKALWQEPGSPFDGRFVAFGNVVQSPRPVQLPHPPLVVGGESKAAMRRARAAGGWYGWDHTPERVAEIKAELGPDIEITITPSPPGPIAREAVEAYQQAGVDRLVLQPSDTSGAAMDELIASIR